VLEWCETCGNVQLRDTLPSAVLYRDYLYTTPDSPTLQDHYARLINYFRREHLLTGGSSAIEIGSNAGHFLRHLMGVTDRVVGVDPAREIAEAANRAGLRTLPEFFHREVGRRMREEFGLAHLVVARHCLAHNASPHEMLAGVTEVLAENGHLVIENAYIVSTITNVEFDQVYHEHMFYYSATSMSALLRMHGMRLTDAWLASVHGGSIVFVASRDQDVAPTPRLEKLRKAEAAVLTGDSFARFASRSDAIRQALRARVVELNAQGQTVYAYGATAKGSTLLNSSGITHEQIPYCVDSTPIKQGRFLPGSGIEVIPERHDHPAPDYYLLTAWNYEDEIIRKVRTAGNHSTRFIVPIPEVRVV